MDKLMIDGTWKQPGDSLSFVHHARSIYMHHAYVYTGGQSTPNIGHTALSAHVIDSTYIHKTLRAAAWTSPRTLSYLFRCMWR